MRQGTAIASAQARGAWPLVAALALVAVLGAAGLTFWRLADVDPRGRASWSPAATVFDAEPRDLTIFLPACDVRAIVLHPAADARGRLSVEYLRTTFGPRGHVRSSTWGAGEQVRAAGSAPVVLARGNLVGDWREAVTLRVRVVGQDGISRRDLPPVALDARHPVSVKTVASPVPGALACAFDGGSQIRAWAVIAATLLAVVLSALLGAAWIARALAPSGAAPALLRHATAIPLALVGATTVTYSLVVPPFEAPDELAHLQYARYVATTGSLPRAVPPDGSDWEASAYEWVQQPLYYLGAAAVLKATALETPGPALRENPRSRMHEGGTEPTVFHHAGTPVPRTGHDALRVLRFASLVMALGTAWAVARLVSSVSDDRLVTVTVAGGLGLVPQWAAVMGAVSTDPPATLLSSVATLAIVRIAGGRLGTGWLVCAGLAIGAAYAVKATAIFLAPMALVACLVATARRPSAGADSDSPPRSRPERWRGAMRAIANPRAGSVHVSTTSSPVWAMRRPISTSSADVSEASST